MQPILQVEDDPNDVFFLGKAMKKAGVANSIQVATDGQMAIDYLSGSGKFADRNQFPLPCLVLLDLKLSHIMGFEVLEWIRKHHGMYLVVLLLTSSNQASDIATAYRLGANGYLVKPSNSTELEAIAKAIQDFWLTHNILPPDSEPAPCSAGPGPQYSNRNRRNAGFTSAAITAGSAHSSVEVV